MSDRIPVIDVKGLRRIYQVGDSEVAALDHVDMTVHEGEFIAIVGPSGSGKSTLMYILGLLDQPTAGSYQLAGTEVSNLDDQALSTQRNRAIGYVFQQYNLLPDIDVVDNVAVGMNYAGVDRDARRDDAANLIKAVGLGHRLGHTPRELSGGQMQRVAVARGLAMRPNLVLADEPTGNLDSKTGVEIMGLFRQLHAAGHTIVLVTHDNEVAQQADRIVRIVDGRIVSDENSPREYTPSSNQNPVELPERDFDLQREGKMRWVDTLRIAIREGLLAHKLRTLLTMLGIVFGIASVIAMTAITEGGKAQQIEQIRQIGLNNVQIQAKDLDGGKLIRERRKHVFGLTTNDLNALLQYVDGIDAASGWREVKTQIRFGDITVDDVPTLGIIGDFQHVTNFHVGDGRFIETWDQERVNRVCVLGYGLARDLDITESDLGERAIVVGDEPFTVVGIMEPKAFSESSIGDINISNRNQELYLPLASLQAFFRDERLSSELDTISLRMANDQGLVERSQLIEHMIRELHNRADDFAVAVPLEILKQTQRTKEIFNIIIVVIAAMALIVGGIGIMNIMLANVTERTVEIGIRRAVGASRQDIVRQFLTEALVIAAIGGLVGLLFGITGAFVVQGFFGFPVAFNVTIMVTAVIVSCGIGIVFGLYPAMQAAHRDPVEALRS